MTKQSGFFRKYEEGREGNLRPGNKLTVISQTGNTLLVETSKGIQETIFASEISLSATKVTKEQVEAALPLVTDASDGDKHYMELLKLAEKTGGLQLDTETERRLVQDHEDPVSVAKELLSSSTSNQFKFAGVLAYICYYQTYQEHGHDKNGKPYTFRSFCDEKFNISSSQSYDLAKMYVKFHTYDLTEADFIELGVSKSKALALALCDANKDLLMNNVRSMPVDSFKKFIRTLKVTGIEKMESAIEGDKVPTTNYNFKLFGDQKAIFEEAMALAAQVIPEYADNPTFLLTHILSEWVDSQTTKTSNLGTIEQEINYLRGHFKDYDIEFSEKEGTPQRHSPQSDTQEVVLV